MAIRKNGKKIEKKEDFNYNVVEKCGVVAERNNGYTLELRFVEWNDNPGKYDLRAWKQKDDGSEVYTKGITLTGEELESLGELVIKLASND